MLGVLRILWSVVALTAWLVPSESAGPFYEGKTVAIIVGFSAGGGFDSYSRAFARHLPKHIPGNPTIVVQNIPGAGSLIAANRLYNIAKPDGLTMGHFIGSLFMAQLLDRPGIQFDARRFKYVAAPVPDTPVCVLSKVSGIANVREWMAAETPVKLGGTAPGNTTDDHANILKAATGLPIQLVSGYGGTANIRLAVEKGEVSGGCWTWDSIKSSWAVAIDSGDIVVPVQMMARPHSDLPDVPLAIDLAKTDEGRSLIKTAIHDMNDIIRPYVMPPGTPDDRVQILRQAFADTMKDPEFLADLQKSNLALQPLSGEHIQATVDGLFNVSPVVLKNLKTALGGT